MELGKDKARKVTLADFRKKIFRSRFRGKRGQIGPRNDSFNIISKRLHLFFLIFCMWLEVINALLLAKTARPAKIWFRSHGPKGGQIGPRKVPFDIISKSLSQIFLIFCMLIEAINALLLVKTERPEKIRFRSYGSKGVQIGVKSGPERTLSILSQKVLSGFSRFYACE